MSNLVLRAITGSIFVAGMIAAFWYGPYSTLLVTVLLVALGTKEFIHFFDTEKQRQPALGKTMVTAVAITLLLASIQLGLLPSPFATLIFPIVFSYLASDIWSGKAQPIERLGLGVLSMIYLIVPAYFILELSIVSTAESSYVIGMFVLIWTNDTFAYLTGRMIGKTKLFERISPKKTWEGTLGGLLFTIGFGYLIGSYVDTHSGVLFWMVAAAIIAPAAIIGDLLESLFKRSRNVKDSGNILPGHGGILDRFDAALFTVPFFYAWWLIYTLSPTAN